jgi:ribosome-associated protein
MAVNPSEVNPQDSPPREYIKLDQFLKLADVVSTGGQAKFLILDGQVKVNGLVETRRGRKLYAGDRVEVDGDEMVVMVTED